MTLNQSVVVIHTKFVFVVAPLYGTPIPHIARVWRYEREFTCRLCIDCKKIYEMFTVSSSNGTLRKQIMSYD